ncbi:unannotated protein [freshwater metagenome]|uniref:Unannotated protein n=1 Tax=freshwater metagenome TaxID=449393 RepID=A0A6J6N350_9ZZZZ
MMCSDEVMGQIGSALHELFSMARPGSGHNHNLSTAEVGSPAQVEIFAMEVGGLIEPANGAEQVSAYQQTR